VRRRLLLTFVSSCFCVPAAAQDMRLPIRTGYYAGALSGLPLPPGTDPCFKDYGGAKPDMYWNGQQFVGKGWDQLIVAVSPGKSLLGLGGPAFRVRVRANGEETDDIWSVPNPKTVYLNADPIIWCADTLAEFKRLKALHQVKPLPAASVAQAGTKQEGWVTNSGNFGVSIFGFADDGFSNISFGCGGGTHSVPFGFDPRGYHGHALRKVLELEQPFILQVRSVSDDNQKFRLIAYMAGDGAWTQTRERELTGSLATAFLDAFSRADRLSLQTGTGVELASWTLKDTSKIRELMRNNCQL
jgi:hypothetical protein